MRYIDSGPEDGVPVVMVHGNLSTGRFYEHLMPGAPAGYRLIAPDMRGFGDTERKPIDATRGLHDWADDTFSLVQALGITRPVHLVGWSTGGAAIGNYAVDRSVASLTFVDPVSPYGFGGVKLDPHRAFPITPGRAAAPGTRTSLSASPITTPHPSRRSRPAMSSTPRTGRPRIASRQSARTCSSRKS
jgi:pimeloyl-ACP methyl ester carboxylesterase